MSIVSFLVGLNLNDYLMKLNNYQSIIILKEIRIE